MVAGMTARARFGERVHDDRMDGHLRRLRSVIALVAALGLALGQATTGAGGAHAADASVPPRAAPVSAAPGPWDGSVNLYRKGVFTTQKTWLWCTAAGVQIARNMVERNDDHARASQERYFDWMRRRNRYDLPESAGVDPAGWTAGMRRFVDDRYRLVASGSFDEALRLAVIRIRKTNLPVALTVSHGNHGWLLHGFAATADPLKTADFRVTSVRVTGPLWGRQDSSFGYDMRPNTKLTPKQLRTFFTPWKYAPKAMIWDGRYVSIQPVTPRKAASMSASASGGAAAPSVAPDAPASQTPTGAPSPPAPSANAAALPSAPTAPSPTSAPVAAAARPSPSVAANPAIGSPAPAAVVEAPRERAPGREVALPFLAVGSVFALVWLVIVQRRHPRRWTGRDAPPG